MKLEEIKTAEEALNMDNFKLENWLPMEPEKGPPLPRLFGLYWPWYKVGAPPPEGYVCPYCGDSFSTYEELAAHIQSIHPGERIPLPIEWE